MLSLMMVFVLFGTLLPVLQEIHEKLELKKERVAAFDTMHEGALEMQAQQTSAGSRTVNGIVYQWEMEDSLCVSYTTFKGVPTAICLE